LERTLAETLSCYGGAAIEIPAANASHPRSHGPPRNIRLLARRNGIATLNADQ
jgi:hypothetical protein